MRERESVGWNDQNNHWIDHSTFSLRFSLRGGTVSPCLMLPLKSQQKGFIHFTGRLPRDCFTRRCGRNLDINFYDVS
jgi:hypothetical protein